MSTQRPAHDVARLVTGWPGVLDLEKKFASKPILATEPLADLMSSAFAERPTLVDVSTD
jgi:hypothetical protein